MLDMDLQENPLNGRRDIAKKVLCFSCKVPFISDRLRLTCKCCRPWGLTAGHGVSGKSLELSQRYS